MKLEEAETHLIGLRNILIHLGMMEGKVVNTVKRTYLENYSSVRSEVRGMWYPSVKLNEEVKKDQVVGIIRDYFGKDVMQVKAILDGIVTVIRTNPNVNVGNVMIEQGHPYAYES